MGRPVNWAPLAGSDPIPGEPDAISGEARRLRDMAVEMRSQISRLRSIGHDDNQGLYADRLRTAASDLAGKLEQAVGRYERVAGGAVVVVAGAVAGPGRVGAGAAAGAIC